MPFTRRVLLAAAVGCGLIPLPAEGGDDKPPAADDAAIKAIVAHFAKNGVKLEKEKEGNWWVVTDPKGDGYDVIVAWRTFPAKATEEEMKAELKQINLAFMLNAPARVAMSHPGLRSADPAKKPPPLDQVRVVAKLEKLFKDYKPPTTARGADGQPPAAKEGRRRDPVFGHLPEAVRSVFESTFPNHRCVRMAIRQEKGAAVYRGTVFDPASAGAETRRVGEESVTQPILYHLEVSGDAKVFEETPHPVLDLERLPKAVLTRYEKWNPKGVKGREHWWTTEVPRGEARVYRVRIIVNAVMAYTASFKEDGSVLAADPPIVP